jgi:ATP-binding cassette subfamily F protein 3
MSLITASNVSLSHGPDDIFWDATLSIARGARIAIVGPNGVGKTSLLRILVGLEEPTTGAVQRSRKLAIGYLPQEAGLIASHTLWEECLRPFTDLRNLETRLATLEAAMADSQQADEALARYGPLQEKFEHLGGYTYETRIRQTLTGLGFEAADFERPLAQLSGGQRTRALLARLLLSDPELLVLDEPTNHLDIAAVEWLEGYLNKWEGTALLVSHDRYFLDKVVDNVWEMRQSGIEVFHGNYSAYVQQRQERWELRYKLYEREKERLEKELDYVKRNIAGQLAVQAKGRLRRLSRQLDAIDKGGLEAIQGKKWHQVSEETGAQAQVMSIDEAHRRIRALRSPSGKPPALKLNLGARHRSGNIILRTSELSVGYPGNPLFMVDELELRRLECAAILGPNGSGKTTFLKTILDQVPPLAGDLSLGASLEIGYFAQAHEDLNPDFTLVEEIDAVKPSMLLAEIRHYLARFLFTGGDVFRPVSTLSGGERGRLALAKLALSQANLLLLDEPTNHLDIPSQEVLQEVLAEFQGTILLVSHDRYLIDALATQIWDIDQDTSSLQIFKGTYTEYHTQQEAEKLAAVAETEVVEPVSIPQPKSRSGMTEHQRQIRLEAIETRIAYLERDLADISMQLEDPPEDAKKVQHLGEDYVEIQNEINALLDEWEQLHTEV